MTQEELDRQLSEIPDEVLIEKSIAILQDWCKGGKNFTMSVPPTKNCPDLLIAELIERFKKHSDMEAKYYRVYFGGNVAAKIKVHNNEIYVEAAIDGYASTINPENIKIEETN
jgi:hypothetical protein